jgi:hypothetical protein
MKDHQPCKYICMRTIMVYKKYTLLATYDISSINVLGVWTTSRKRV